MYKGPFKASHTDALHLDLQTQSNQNSTMTEDPLETESSENMRENERPCETPSSKSMSKLKENVLSGILPLQKKRRFICTHLDADLFRKM